METTIQQDMQWDDSTLEAIIKGQTSEAEIVAVCMELGAALGRTETSEEVAESLACTLGEVALYYEETRTQRVAETPESTQPQKRRLVRW